MPANDTESDTESDTENDTEQWLEALGAATWAERAAASARFQSRGE